MTNIQNWDQLIRIDSIPLRISGADPAKYSPRDYRSAYYMLPLNDYQLGNLAGLLKRSHAQDNGDWYYELFHIIEAAMRKLNIEELTNNFGDIITLENLYDPVKDEEESE